MDAAQYRNGCPHHRGARREMGTLERIVGDVDWFPVKPLVAATEQQASLVNLHEWAGQHRTPVANTKSSASWAVAVPASWRRRDGVASVARGTLTPASDRQLVQGTCDRPSSQLTPVSDVGPVPGGVATQPSSGAAVAQRGRGDCDRRRAAFHVNHAPPAPAWTGSRRSAGLPQRICSRVRQRA